MSELIERVANDVRQRLNAMPFAERTIEATVRLVIEALREPTEEMWRAEQPTWSLGRPMWDWWRSVIDEALK